MTEAELLKRRPMISHIARGFNLHCSAFDTDDLIQCGWVGLIEASKHFDPSIGVSFPKFAERRVRGAMLDFLRGVDVVTKRDRAAIKAGTKPPVFTVSLDALLTDALWEEPAAVKGVEADMNLQGFIAQLPKLEAEVIRRMWLEEEPVVKIARDLECSGTHVYNMSSKAIGTLRGLYGHQERAIEELNT